MKKIPIIICSIIIVAIFAASFNHMFIVRADVEPEPISDPLPWGLFGENGIDIKNAWKITNEAPDVTVGVVDSGICGRRI